MSGLPVFSLKASGRVFAQAMPNHVWAATGDGELYWFNEQVYAYSGTAPGELDGTAWSSIVHPDDVGGAGRAWAGALETGIHYETEFRIRRSDGAYRWFLVRAEPIRGSDGSVTRWIGTNTDIEDRRRAVAQLERLNETLEQQVDALRQSLERQAQATPVPDDWCYVHDFDDPQRPRAIRVRSILCPIC